MAAIAVTGNTPQTMPENRAFYPALDGLRALAFLMVFCQHYFQMPWGWAGVDLFFVLSGFLITGILFDTRNEPYRIQNFYVRRTLRIFPLYYGVMMGLLILQPLVDWHWNWHWLVWPFYVGNYARCFPYRASSALENLANLWLSGSVKHFQFTLYLGHFWSLCVEEQFYLIWPWIVFSTRDRRRLLQVCVAAIPICLLMRLTGQHVLPRWMLDHQVLYEVTPFRLDALLIGGAMALALRGHAGTRILTTARKVLPIVIVVILLWIIISPDGHVWKQHYSYPIWTYTWGLTALDIISALLILVTLAPGSILYRVLSIPALRWLGRISYGAYVFHDIPHTLYWRVAAKLVGHFEIVGANSFRRFEIESTILAGVIALLATLVLAGLSFRFFESPLLSLKEKWSRRPFARTRAATI